MSSKVTFEIDDSGELSIPSLRSSFSLHYARSELTGYLARHKQHQIIADWLTE